MQQFNIQEKQYLYAHFESGVREIIATCATWLMLANASPRNPYVTIDPKSSNFLSLLVVKRSQTISMSSFWNQNTSEHLEMEYLCFFM